MIAKTLAEYGVARPNGNAARKSKLPCPGDDAQPCLGGGYVARFVFRKSTETKMRR
jgi:hypothetical protein